MFSCKFWEISKNIFSYRTPPVAASEERKAKEHTKLEKSKTLNVGNIGNLRIFFQVFFSAFLIFDIESKSKSRRRRSRKKISEASEFSTRPKMSILAKISLTKAKIYVSFKSRLFCKHSHL